MKFPSEPLPTPIKVTGTIKWFDPNKGFGFITPDDGTADVLLHVSCLQDVLFHAERKGARIVVEAEPMPKGLRACRLISLDESTAVLAPQKIREPRTHVTVTPTSGLERATVKWFNRWRGFAFVTRLSGPPDIFVHMEVMRKYGIEKLKENQDVLVRYGQGPKGLMASEVRLV